MAKVPFSRLKCKINTSEIPVQLGEETIAVKQYLPIQEKLALISEIITQAHDQDNNFANPVKINVFKNLDIIFAYTNISFTDKQKEDLPKLYDLLYSCGAMDAILSSIPNEELKILNDGVEKTIKAVYDYQNSALGILDSIKADYNETDFDINKLISEIKDPEALKVLKDIVEDFN